MSDRSSQAALSRRGFLRGSAVATATAAISGQASAQAEGGASAAPDAPSGARAHEKVEVRLNLNGEDRLIQVGPDTSALSVLRERLGLTGSKLGCGHGACGACTALVDGVPHVTCLLPAVALEGRSLTTVEGLAPGDDPTALHPVQRAMAAEDALQCGFCTPGFAVEAAAFVDAWRAANGTLAPSRDVVADALSGHLCRCGAYDNLYAAVQAACAGRYDRAGVAAQRVDALDKITGKAVYTADVQVPGMLTGRILRAPLAHGVIEELDVRPALQLSGVKAAVPLSQVGHKVRYAGQELAAVAATTPEAAAAALAAITVRISPLQHVLDMDAATKPDAPVLYAKGDPKPPSASEGPVFGAKWDGNARGPVSSAFFNRKRAAARLLTERAAREPKDSTRFVRGTWRAHTQCHTALEPHCAVARFNDGGTVDLWCSTQSVGFLAEDVAQRFKLKRDQVRVHAAYVGGGFGAKVGLQVEALAALKLSRESGAPVSVVLDRGEELVAGGVRPAQELTVTLALDEAGAMEAVGMEGRADSGVAVGTLAGFLARIVYPAAYKHLDEWDVVTNTSPGKPFRGPGGPAAFFALEGAVDDLARRRKLDPVAARKRWDPNPARQRLYRWVDSVAAWRERPTPGSSTGRFRTGVGLAMGGWPAFVDPGTQVQITASADSVVVSTTCQDIGTGSRSVLAHSVARILDLSPHRIRVDIGDSGGVHGPMSAGSRTTPSIGPAAEDAARSLTEELARIAEASLGLVGASIERGGLRHSGGSLTWQDVLERVPPVTVVGRRIRDEGGFFLPFSMADINVSKVLPGCLVVTSVTVDTWLGRVDVDRVDIGMGVGRIYVPKLAENQVRGGVLQGLSYALYEDRHFDPVTGRLLTTGLEDYRIAGIGDCPPISVFFDEDGFEKVTGGGVGLGELCTVAVAGSLGNAVAAATGWRPRRLPLTPKRVLQGLSEASA